MEYLRVTSQRHTLVSLVPCSGPPALLSCCEGERNHTRLFQITALGTAGAAPQMPGWAQGKKTPNSRRACLSDGLIMVLGLKLIKTWGSPAVPMGSASTAWPALGLAPEHTGLHQHWNRFCPHCFLCWSVKEVLSQIMRFWDHPIHSSSPVIYFVQFSCVEHTLCYLMSCYSHSVSPTQQQQNHQPAWEENSYQ